MYPSYIHVGCAAEQLHEWVQVFSVLRSIIQKGYDKSMPLSFRNIVTHAHMNGIWLNK